VERQLSLPLGDTADQDLVGPPDRLAFPQATPGGAAFDDPARFFEPWWPGAHAFLRRDGTHITLRTGHLGDPSAAFPELRDAVAALPHDRFVVEGTLLALDVQGRPDEQLLRGWLAGRRIEPRTEAAFVVFDAPWLAGRSLARLPFRERRAHLADAMPDSSHCVLGRGVIGEGRMLARAVADLGLTSISARRLDAPWRAGAQGDAWLRLDVADPPVATAPPFLVAMQRLPLGD
jgi:bifunctional non-homologous end joining protein LigD